MDLSSSLDELDARLTNLENAAVKKFAADGVAAKSMRFEHFLNLRYVGSDTTFMIPRPENQTWEEAFIAEHKRQFSFIMPGRNVLGENVRVRAVAESESVEPNFDINQQLAAAKLTAVPDKKR